MNKNIKRTILKIVVLLLIMLCSVINFKSPESIAAYDETRYKTTWNNDVQTATSVDSEGNTLTWAYYKSHGQITKLYLKSSIPSGLTKLEIPSTLAGLPVVGIGGDEDHNLINNSYNSSITEVVIPESVKSINLFCFQSFYGLTEFNIPSNVKEIYTGAFCGCSNLRSITFEGDIEKMGSEVFFGCTSLQTVDFQNHDVKVGDGAFYGRSSLTTIQNWDNITEIGDNAFRECTGLTGTLVLPTQLEKIGEYAFSGCTGYTGDLIIGANIYSIGNGAFYNCTGFTGDIRIEAQRVIAIPNYAFKDCTNVKKIVLSDRIISVGSYAFEGHTDILVNSAEKNIKFSSNWSGENQGYVHFAGEKHSLKIELLPGIKAFDVDTGAEVTSEDLPCETTKKIRFEVENPSLYPDLKLYVIRDNDFKNLKAVQTEININDTYTLENMFRNTTFTTFNTSPNTDLALRTYIDSINNKSLNIDRKIVTGIENCQIAYKHTKYPEIVETGDVIKYGIRIYNEGKTAGRATKIVEHLPAGIEFIDPSVSANNRTYQWVVSDDGRTVTTDYTKNTDINGYQNNSNPSYTEIFIECKVTAEKQDGQQLRLTNFAEIAESSSTEADSTPNNLNVSDYENYKFEEAKASDSSTYVKGMEDDDDFENVVILRNIPVSYVLKISKIDLDTLKLLEGAKFALLNEKGEVLQEAVTVKNGQLTFDRITTYGEGVDRYYITEVERPEGYRDIIGQTLKISVFKTIIDPVSESYSLKIACDVLESNINSTIDEAALVPIYTKEQFMKIGSKETITIDDKEYVFGDENPYRLMADIDLTGVEWEPLPEIANILDGNNFKIKGLTITNKNIKNVGLFSSFSGIIENLTLENVNISIDLQDDIDQIKRNYKNGSAEQEKAVDEFLSTYCVGGFAGQMKGGAILNSSVSGTIDTGANKVGGFAGYASKEKLVKIKDSTNNANVNGYSNVGGLIGYSDSALNLINCKNNGDIEAVEYNAAGLVGYSEAQEYTPNVISAEYDAKNAIISMTIGNERYIGQYSLELNKIDNTSKQLLDGTKFTICDVDGNVVKGLDEVEVVNGVLNIGSFDIYSSGIDTYFIKEISSANGYEATKDFIKLDVIKTWNGVIGKYIISANTEVVDFSTFENSRRPANMLANITGVKFEYRQDDTIDWLVNKVVASNCTNKGNVTAKLGNAAGIFGKTNCIVDINGTTNEGNIISTIHAAGMVAEVLKVDNNTNVSISNSTNKGKIELQTLRDTAVPTNVGGMIAYTKATAIVIDCDNEGTIENVRKIERYGSLVNDGESVASGLIAVARENVLIENSNNKGVLNTNGYGAGAIGQVYNSEAAVTVINTTNTGNLRVGNDGAGIAGAISTDKLTLKNCEIRDCTTTSSSYNFGGILATTSSDLYVDGCSVNNVIMEGSAKRFSGIISSVENRSMTIVDGEDLIPVNTNPSVISIKNCEVNNFDIKGSAGYKAGILTFACDGDADIRDIEIDNCSLNDVKFEGGVNRAAGIATELIYYNHLSIKNCTVTDLSIPNGRQDLSAIVAFAQTGNKINDLSNEFSNCTVNSFSAGGGVQHFGNIVATIIANDSYKTVPLIIKDITVSNSPITMVSGSQIAGVVGYAYGQGHNLSIDNCNLENSSITVQGSAEYTAGIIGLFDGNGSINIRDIDIKDSNLISNGGSISGIIGGFSQKAWRSGSDDMITIEDCNIENSEVISNGYGIYNSVLVGFNTYAPMKIKQVRILGKSSDDLAHYSFRGSQASGIGIGFTYHDLEFDDVIIKDCELNSSNYSANNSCLVGALTGNLTVKNSKFENIVHKNTFKSGIIAGYVSKDINIDNCEIKDIDMSYYRGGSGPLGGLVGQCDKDLKINQSTVDNLSITIMDNASPERVAGIMAGTQGGCEITDSSITNINIDATKSNNEYTSGLVAGCATRTILKGATISDITVKGRVSVVGILGYGAIVAEENNSINNITVEQVNKATYSKVSVSGIVGVAMNGTSLKNINANNFNVKGYTDNFEVIAGFIGTTDGSSLEVSDCTLSNSNIEGLKVDGSSYNFNIGGMIAIVPRPNNTLENLTVSSTNVKATLPTGSSNNVGGIVANCGDKINNASVTNSHVELIYESGSGDPRSTCTGGIVGLTVNSNSKIENATVTGTTIVGTYGNVGGVSGFSYSDIKESNIRNSNISSTHNTTFVGGVTGVSGNQCRIENCDIYDSNVSTNGATARNMVGTAGIAGMSDGYVGNCNVVRTTIKSTGDNAYAVGGIVGQGNNVIGINDEPTTIIEKCKVIDSSILGDKAVGGIAGAAVPTISECTVEGTVSEAPRASLKVEPIVEKSNKPITKVETVETKDKVEEPEEAKVSEDVKEEETVEVDNKAEAEETEDVDLEENDEVSEEIIPEDIIIVKSELKETEENASEVEVKDEKEEATEDVKESTVEDKETVVVEEAKEEPKTEIVEENVQVLPEAPINTVSAEIERKTIISGTDMVGGIIGFGGEIPDNEKTPKYEALTITDCIVKNTTIVGKSKTDSDNNVIIDVKEFIGKNTTYIGTKLKDDIITLCKKINVVLKIDDVENKLDDDE